MGRPLTVALFALAAATSLARADATTDKLAKAALDGKLAGEVPALAADLKRLVESADATEEQIVTAAVNYRYAAFFSRIELKEDADRAALAWLIAQPKLSRALCLAVGDFDQPDKVLSVLRALQTAHKTKLEEWPDLAAALCVVWDAPPNKSANGDDPPRGDWAAMLFRYFTAANSRLRFDLRQMPWQLQTYVVDLSVSEAEIAWAWKRYERRGEIGSFYFEVPYDSAAYYQGADKKIGEYAYTLENLQKHGGVCVDQAHFATQIGRLMGVPVVTIVGQGGGGQVGHAWVGFLERKNRTVAWNLKSGRYESQLYWTGQVADPQAREMISESDTSLLAELQNATPKERILAQALLRSLDVFEPKQQPDIIVRILNTSAGHREAWMKLADLGRDGVLTKEQSNAVAEVVKKFAIKQYADLAFAVYRRMISGRSNLDQLEQLDLLAGMFKERPDLVAAIRVEQGKLLQALKRDDQALRAYGEVLGGQLNTGPVILEALQLADDLLRKKKDMKRLVGIYDVVFKSIPQPHQSAYAAYSPFCTIGVRYAELLEDLGDRAAAFKIRQRVATYDTTALPQNQRR